MKKQTVITKNNLPSINILGCCVSRDSIEKNKNSYNICNYAPFISAYSLCNSKKINLNIDDLIKSGLSPFRARVIYLDAQNSVVNYIRECKTEWLLLDIADSRMDILAWPSEGIYITNNSYIQEFLPKFRCLFPKSNPIIIKAWQIPLNKLIDSLAKLLDQILQIYSPEKIIFNEFYRANEYVAVDGTLHKFTGSTLEINKKWNNILKSLNEFAEKKLTGCHIIKPLTNSLSDEKNKWGLSPFHYCDDYYEYIEKSINIIINNNDPYVLPIVLRELNSFYNERFLLIKSNAAYKNVLFEKEKWKKYSYTFKTLIINNLILISDKNLLCLATRMLEKGYRHIAIYGDTEITKVLCKVLENEAEIIIDYIVENANNPIQGIKTINRSDTEYPDCDLMLIADIYYYKEIKAKLEKMKVPFPFYNAAEFIQSLPAGDNDSINKIKKYIADLSEQLSASVKNEAKLTEQLNDLTKQDIDSKRTIDKLNNDIKLMSDNKNKILAEKQKAASERDVALSELDAANSEIQAIRNSISFKVGRGLTLIPRKIRDFIKAKKKQ